MAETNTLRDVVVQAQTGNHDAFSKLVRRFQDMAVGYAYSVIGDFHLAEDAAQEAFAAAWIELPRIREPDAFAGWIRRIVFTRPTRFTRKMRRDHVTLESVGELAEPLEVTDGNEEVYLALSELPDDERIATTLFYFGSHSHDRIADFLGLTPATVNNRLRSAGKRMKRGLIEMTEETFKREIPSRNEAFETRIKKLTQPRLMETDHYIYGVEQLNGHDAWALFCAAAAGDLVRVRALLDCDPRLVNAQHFYQFPIHMAVREGRADVVHLLLVSGADPGQSRFQYNSWDKMLVVAEERGHRSVKKLLESAMAERFNYSSEFNPLRDAIKGRDVEAVDRLMKASPGLAKASDALGNRCIHWAVLTRQLNLIDRFLERGADVDARRADGQTPLLVSINGDYWYRWYRNLPEDTMKNTWVVSGFLLGKGAKYDFCTACGLGDGEHVRKVLKQDPAAANRLNEHNQSPLYYAARYGRVRVCEMLIACGANPNQPEDLAPRGHALFEASALNHLKTAELLLKAGADPNGHVDSSGSCITIVEDRHPETCGPMQELLRKHGAYTPVWNLTVEELKERLRGESEALSDGMFFHHILAQDDPEIFDLFVEYCGDRLPSFAPTDVYGGNVAPPDQMQKLINHGIDPNRPNWIGRTFLHSCASNGAIDSARVLLENGAEIDSVDLEFGSTPLAEAVREGQTEMVKFLREQGADPDAPEESTWGTARAVAKRKGDEEMARLLG